MGRKAEFLRDSRGVCHEDPYEQMANRMRSSNCFIY